ncbi:hypothetical protein B1J97_04325 [Aeromonas veronii]|nr:hypothetical protein [Aeromonas veronii]RRA90463.1 hypothetical protein AVS_14785 [Aeromonas veronii bv. sobria]TNI74157.1 hypothetical protein CF109_06930 [Aeromonas veronii]
MVPLCVAQCRQMCRPAKKLLLGCPLFAMIISLLRQRLFPEQIAGLLLKRSRFEDVYVCREITYNAIYAMPVGELRKELIICLRYGK